jgi:ankyrin repeat protein
MIGEGEMKKTGLIVPINQSNYSFLRIKEKMVLKKSRKILILLCTSVLFFACAEEKPVETEAKTPLEQMEAAISSGDLVTVQSLIESGLDVDTSTHEGVTLMWLALEEEQEVILKYLIEVGADISVRGKNEATVFMEAASKGYLDVLKTQPAEYYRQYHTDKFGNTVIHFAGLSAQTELIKYILELGLDVNRPNSTGRTLLHNFVFVKDDPEFVQFLIEKGANVNAFDTQNKQYPIMSSLGNDHFESTKILIEFGSDVDTKDIFGSTILHISVARNQKEITRMIIDRGADINVLNGEGATPLHNAVQYSDKAMVLDLLQSGADPTIQNRQEDTPLTWAARNGKQDIVELIESYISN